MKPKFTLRSFLILAGSSLLAISYSNGQTLANSYLTTLDVTSPVTLLPAGGFPSFMVGPFTDSSDLAIAGGFTQTSSVNGIVSFTNNGSSNAFNRNIIVEPGTHRIAGNTITYTKRGLPYGTDLTYIIETSETLVGAWKDVVTHGPGLLVSNPTISYTFTPGTPVKKFARLEVLSAP